MPKKISDELSAFGVQKEELQFAGYKLNLPNSDKFIQWFLSMLGNSSNIDLTTHLDEESINSPLPFEFFKIKGLSDGYLSDKYKDIPSVIMYFISIRKLELKILILLIHEYNIDSRLPEIMEIKCLETLSIKLDREFVDANMILVEAILRSIFLDFSLGVCDIPKYDIVCKDLKNKDI